MKHYQLKQITKYLSKFKSIFSIERVDDTILKIAFDKTNIIYVDLKRGNSTFFMCDNFIKQKVYNAPFDVILTKNFTRSVIEKIEIEDKNRIVRFFVKSNSKYKSTNFILQLEFTGKNTNAIILDNKNIVLEALQHIDLRVSFRQVSVGCELLPLESREFKEEEKTIEDISKFLHEVYESRQKARLEILKQSKKSFILKKQKRLEKELDKLPNEEQLNQKSKEYNENGSLVLANLHEIRIYDKQTKLKDFEGNEKTIVLPKEAKTPQNAANIFFAQSKKLRQKATSIHIERDSLRQKIDFYKKLNLMIENSKSIEEVQVLAPKQKNHAKKTKQSDMFESFFIEGFKIMVGKSQKSNIALFKVAKKNDIWLHIQQTPSAHVIIRTNKQNLPQNVLEFSAKLCLNFTGVKDGSYLVDYTKWQYVRIDSGSNVFYTDFKTIRINKD